MQLTPSKVKAFQEKILSFYKEQGRDLPWRKTTNRYYILVSELMLQQTQVTRVIEKYKLWIETVPTIKSLADAPLSKVLELWQGLGYNSRAKRLQDAAKIIVEQHEGKVPATPEELITLPGIGPYTARSVLIFADNQNIATVDTNIRRIFIHEFNLPENTSDKELFELAEQLLPQGKSRDWHNGLMDYGSTILTARKSGIKPKTKQSTFKGSVRQFRGKVLKQLILEKQVTKKQLQDTYKDAPKPILEIADQLVEEGLLEKTRTGYQIKGH
jgi:A/G-specific adenine glycosylase